MTSYIISAYYRMYILITLPESHAISYSMYVRCILLSFILTTSGSLFKHHLMRVLTVKHLTLYNDYNMTQVTL